MCQSRRLAAILGLIFLLQPVVAQEFGVVKKRPRIGLVLSGGGARGAAHVGVLRVLEELRIPIDLIAGNSMGSLVGGLYAYGHSPQQLEEILTGINWALVLKDGILRHNLSFRRKQDDANFLIDMSLGVRDFKIVPRKGLLQGQLTLNILKFLTPQSFRLQSFDDLSIRFRAVATEISTGEQVVMKDGSLPLAMFASMAIPGVFSPVVIDGRELVDGMVVNNIPIDIAKAMGADVIIASDIGSPLLNADEITSLLKVTQQMLNILMQKNVDARLELIGEKDILIQPDLGSITAGDFGRADEAIAIGEKATRAMAERLKKYSVSKADYERFLAQQRRPTLQDYPVIDKLTIINDSPLADGVIRAQMETNEGEPLDPEVLKRDIDRIFGLEDFERVTWEFEKTEEGETELFVLADQKSWGPNYLRFGLNITDNFDGDAAYNFGVNYTMRMLNSLGGEWRNDVQIGEHARVFSEFYQPLDQAGQFFIAPQIRYDKLPINQFQGGAKVAEYDIRFGQLGLDVGTHFDNWAELRFGIRRSVGDVDVTVSTTPQSDFTFDDFYFRTSLLVDTFDEVNFPSSGTAASFHWDYASEDAGADVPYERIDASLAQAMTYAKNTVIVAARYGTARKDTLPAYRLHRRGGFLDLSGLEHRELTGQHTALFKLIAYRQISGDRIKTLGMPIYIGGSIEMGDVWDRRGAILDDMRLAGSVFLGADSPLGPLYFGYGLTDGGRDSFYLFLGRTF